MLDIMGYDTNKVSNDFHHKLYVYEATVHRTELAPRGVRWVGGTQPPPASTR